MQRVLKVFFVLFTLLPGLVLADKPSDNRAINGMQTGKILWDITLANPENLLSRLNVLEETYEDMIRQKIKPQMIFTFRGGAAGLIARDLSHLDIDKAAAVGQVQYKLSELMKRPGIHMEACQIATRRFNLTEQNQLMPGILLVGNTFLSIMGYENKGYTTIRID